MKNQKVFSKIMKKHMQKQTNRLKLRKVQRCRKVHMLQYELRVHKWQLALCKYFFLPYSVLLSNENEFFDP